MAIQLYIYGCQTCGVNSVHVRRLKAHCFHAGIDLEIKNTKYDKAALATHVSYLGDNLETDIYPPVVVDGNTATPLREWQP